MESTKAILLLTQPDGELRALLEAAGGTCEQEIVQNLAEPDPDFFLREGKIKEILPGSANTVIADGALTPRQARNLFKATGLTPIDRTTLVLYIFALRARTKGSKLQVEAAQLEHLRGQLRGMWPHLNRTGGGIGTRGPGETQLETDRRLLDRRLRQIKKDLKDLKKEREMQRKERLSSPFVRATLWGYTNSGKSTLALNLGAKDALPSSRVFSTLDPQTRKVSLGTHSLLLTDTVGIIKNMPPEIIEAFASTLEESLDCHLLIHVLSGKRWREELLVGEDLLDQIGFNKNKILVINGEATGRLPRGSIYLPSPKDIRPLIRALEQDFWNRSREVSLLFPYKEQSKLSALYRQSAVIDRTNLEEGVAVRARILPSSIPLFSAFSR